MINLFQDSAGSFAGVAHALDGTIPDFPMGNEVPPATVAFMTKVSDNIINPIIAVIFALALVYFLYGLLTFILNAGNESGRAIGKQHMVWGTIGMVVMVSVFAILQMVLLTFEIGGDDLPAGIL
jgi:succinate dehydrogenase/fumarate reductase cytochrome b subunit